MRYNAARWFTLIAAMFALSFAAGSAFAQDDDPPNRAARLSYASGSVSFEPAGTDDWVDAVVNRPMTTGDKLWADQDGRVEVRIDSYALRLGPQTGFSFLNLDDRVVQVRLTEGSLNIRVRRLDENQTLEIDTPNLAFNVLRPGSYRIDVNENGDATLVTVRDGQGEVTGGGSAYPIRAGDSVNFSGVDELNADVEGIGGGDDFDQWSESRDQRWEHSTSAQYVSDDAVGYEDLDENGQWNSDPDYGTVWYPRNVAADWAPYRYGHWVWVSPWGWTWVDDASWGFAPFHYGRWVVARGRWGWVPSPPRPAYVTREYVRPVYAPALVAWVGGGAAVGVGVAWFPLGPRDVYTPSYHVSERYVERVNVSNTRIVNRTQVTNVYNTVYVNKTVNVTNITYQNQRANNSVTATSQASFTTAQPVGRNQVRVDARQMAAAPVTPLASVAPQQRSFAGAGGAAKAHPPANFASRNVVAKTAPPPAPVPVAQQMKAAQANGGRPVAAAQVRANQPEAARANVKVAAPAKVAALPPKGNSVNRPGQPVRPAQANQQNQPATAQPNANRPANVNPNTPNAGNPNQPNPNRPNPNAPNANANRPAPDQPNANPNAPNGNRPNATNPNRPNANPPAANPPNANRPNANPNTPSAENPNRPAPNQPNANPNAPNGNRPNAANPNRPDANPPAANPPNANRPNANPNTPNAENPNRPNPNRPPTATPNNPNANNPNASRPADNRPAATDRPPAVRQSTEPQTQQRQQQQADQLRQQQQQQERQNAEQQRAQQQQRLEQQRADVQKRQDVQRQQQQQQQKEAAKPQPKEQQPPPREAAKPQPKEQQPPPKKDNKDNKEKDKKDRPPSR